METSKADIHVTPADTDVNLSRAEIVKSLQLRILAASKSRRDLKAQLAEQFRFTALLRENG